MNEKLPFKILCPFCDTPYTAKMELELEDSMEGCETCGPEAAELKLEIKCEKCERVVYVKEGKSYDF